MGDDMPIRALLESRHARDLFWHEVKDGPTIFGNHLRLDALAVPKTWSPATLIGYEIKSDRADWLRDHKWEKYRDLVHILWIAAERGAIKPEEVPDGVGLLERSKTGNILRTIKKPVRSKIEPPWELLLYLLMSRTRPDNERAKTRDERIAEWRERKEEGKAIGYWLTGKINERLQDLSHAARSAGELRELENWLRGLDHYGHGSLLQRVQAAIDAPSQRKIDAANALGFAVKRAIDMLEPTAQEIPHG